MTAEIALLNKESVALAADSAVTIRTPGGTKILPSANKIFALSKYQPVGIMVYGNAQLLGVPWELIVKSYRKHLGDTKFPRLADYATDFNRYLERASDIFPTERQEQHCREVASAVFKMILKSIERSIAGLLVEHEKIDEEGIRAVVRHHVDEAYSSTEELELQEGLDVEFLNTVTEHWRSDLLEGIQTIFEDFVNEDDLRERLIEIAISWVCKAVPNVNEGDSGVVVAGFGTGDVFPSLRSFKIEGIVMDRLIYRPTVDHDVADRGASIIPFAQVDMVHTFMEGVDQTYQTAVEEAVEQALLQLAKAASDESGKTGADLRGYSGALSAIARDAAAKFRTLTQTYRSAQYVQPAVSVVDILPKDRLAAMAESLVDITALRRQFSLSEETVGGPIDVAVISKGDGLIWIKRKHYFEKDLNPQFFHNYFIEE